MTETPLLYRSIDDYLGPGETRFFGAGYRRARHRVVDVEVDAPGTRATVDVAYPTDWSTKSEKIDLRPHLSTVDMLVLGAQLSEAHLAHAYGLDEQARASAWLRKVTLRSGNTPQEELVGLPGKAILRGTTAVPGVPGLHDSVYECAVGVMRARYEIRHASGAHVTTAGRYPTLDDVLGDAASRYYGTGFTAQHHDVSDVRIDMSELHAEATVRIGQVDDAPTSIRGMDGAYQPAVSPVDCFVVDLQLAQVLMYELDSLRRSESNTLWMLRTVLEMSTPLRPYPAPLVATAKITDRHLVPLRGARWRNVDIEGDCGGVSLRCSFAHQLPGDFTTPLDQEPRRRATNREGTR